MYIKTERFRNNLDRTIDILRSRGYEEEWHFVTPYQEESRMCNLLKNKVAYLRAEDNQTVVDYLRGNGDRD